MHPLTEPSQDDETELRGAVYVDLADRFRALSDLFQRFGTPEGARRLMDTLIEGSPERFGELVAQLDFPMLGKCVWLRDVVERVVVTWTGKKTVYWIRDDLTPAERRLLFRLIVRYRVFESSSSMTVDGHEIIPEGPFLDALKANGLVASKVIDTYDSRLTKVLGKPELVCL